MHVNPMAENEGGWSGVGKSDEKCSRTHGRVQVGEESLRLFAHECKSNRPKAVHERYNSRESVLKKEILFEGLSKIMEST